MNDRMKMLVVDTNHADRKITALTFDESFEVLEAENADEAMVHLNRWEQSIAVILLDIALPEMKQCRFLRRIKQDVRFSNIPVIVTTRTPNEMDDVMSFRCGASDYIKKPLRVPLIKYKVDTLLRSSDALYAKCDSRDLPTGAYNRDAFFNKTELRIQKTARFPYWIVCAKIMNFDKLKKRCSEYRLNDLLRFIATQLSVIVCDGHGDCGRVYDDCFAICLAQDIEHIKFLLKTVMQRVIAYPFNTDVVIRFGAVCCDETPVEQMCSNAVQAIEQDNEFVAIYDDYLKRCQDKELAGHLRIGLCNDLFDLSFTPIYDTREREMTGVISEFVWKDSAGRSFDWDKYKDTVNANGLAKAFDKQFYEKLFSFVKTNPNGTTPTVYMHLSAEGILNPLYPQILADTVSNFKLSPRQFALIISPTDFALVPSSKSAVEKFRALGFLVALGELGDSDCPLDICSSADFDAIILSFEHLRNNDSFERRAIYLNTAIRLSKLKQVPLIATKIESDEERAFAHSIGCTSISGDSMATEDFVNVLKDTELHSVKPSQKLIPQQYLWDTTSPFNCWFQSVGEAMLLVEKVGSILSALRANEYFFTSFSLNPKVFSLCDKPFLSFVLPQYRRELITACNESLAHGRQTQVTLSMRSLDTDNQRIFNVTVRINCVFISKQSSAFLFTIVKHPMCNDCETVNRQRLLLDAACNTNLRAILLFTFEERPLCIYANNTACSYLKFSDVPTEYADLEFGTIFQKYFDQNALYMGLREIRNGRNSVNITARDRPSGIQYVMEMRMIKLLSGERVLRCEFIVEETVSEYTILALCEQ